MGTLRNQLEVQLAAMAGQWAVWTPRDQLLVMLTVMMRVGGQLATGRLCECLLWWRRVWAVAVGRHGRVMMVRSLAWASLVACLGDGVVDLLLLVE